MSVLARYDVRGIQAYVFRTQRLREITAVQDLPEKIIYRALLHAAGAPSDAPADVRYSEAAFLAGQGIRVLDKAGGNAVVRFSDEAAARRISRAMAVYILQETRSLQLVYAWLAYEDGDDLAAVDERLQQRLAARKARTMPLVHAGLPPVCLRDGVTGDAVAWYDANGTPLTEESRRKRMLLREAPDIERLGRYAAHGRLAVVHIDGNSMGARIAAILRDPACGSPEARFSAVTVRECFAAVCREAEAAAARWADAALEPGTPVLCPLIQAGDDITYVVRADYALDFAETFLTAIARRCMRRGMEGTPDAARWRISACAGIAFCTARYPFAAAYALSEALCSEAKRSAHASLGPHGIPGSWLSFDICPGTPEGDVRAGLRQRPFCVDDGWYRDPEHDFAAFRQALAAMHAAPPALSRVQAQRRLQDMYMGKPVPPGIGFDALELAAWEAREEG
ncbi:MAG: hypothetical protein IKI21_00125 [Oscillospiraceae bacterium]|nr:hypothetical protein [Oscillospiraceae bacterium]